MPILTRNFLPLLAMFTLAGCATNFEPTPFSPDHPASAQAQEAPRAGKKRLLATDAVTRKTTAQLERKDAPDSDFENGGMSHDMSSMGGMDHSKMPGMDMKKQPAGAAAAKPVEMDHSKMPGMTMPAATTAESRQAKKRPRRR